MEEVFSSQQTAGITGVTQRQLAYWRKSGLISPSHRTRGGHARYTFSDLIALKTAKQLLDSGVSLQKIRRTISSLTGHLPRLTRPLTELSLVATGDVVLVLHAGTAFEALSGQEWIFPIAKMQRDIERLQQRREEPMPMQQDLFPDWERRGGGSA